MTEQEQMPCMDIEQSHERGVGAEAMVRHLPPPWKFLWDKHGPRVVSSDGRIVASLSSGTINGAYDPAAVMALGKAISGLINDA